MNSTSPSTRRKVQGLKRGMEVAATATVAKVDINLAKLDELATLTGVGRSKAEAIIQTRESLGGFTSVDDLQLVAGVGPSLIDSNRHLLVVSTPKLVSPTKRASSRTNKSRSHEHVAGAGPSSWTGTGDDATSQLHTSPVSRRSRRKTRVSRPSTLSEDDTDTTVPSITPEDTPTPLPLPIPSASASESSVDSITEREELMGQDVCEEDLEEALVRAATKRKSESHGESIPVGEKKVCRRTRQSPPSPAPPKSFEVSTSSSSSSSSSSSAASEVISASLSHGLRHASSNCDSDSCSPPSSPSSLAPPLPPIWTSPTTTTATSPYGPSRKLIPSRENPSPELISWLNTFQAWGNAERCLAIDRLIELCDHTQVIHMMQVIEPQFQRDFISLLPKELALYVLSFLNPKDLVRAAQTCRYWRILAEDNLLWREKCREAGVDDVRETLNKRRRRTLLHTFQNRSDGPVSPSPWKVAYMRQRHIEMNWRIRPLPKPQVLKGHDDHVITCLQFCGNLIVSGSDDNTLKVWSATTGKCLRTLVGHTGGVWSSQMQGHTIVSGSTDRTLKVWNADTGALVHTLYGHTSTVRCMHLHGKRVVSGSRDATLRVWDVETGECLRVLQGHVAAVRCVQYDGRLVVSGAYDYTVKVWDPERQECLHTLTGHTNRVYSLQFDGVHVVSGSLDTSIRVWDAETGACKHTLMGHQSLTSGMELRNNILVSGNADSTVKVWDIITGQCLQTLSGSNKHQSAVTCLQFNNRFVITSSDDGTVKLWDVKTGEFVRNLVALESGGSGGVVWRIRASDTKLVCAVGSRNGTEETKLLVLDFDTDVK